MIWPQYSEWFGHVFLQILSSPFWGSYDQCFFVNYDHSSMKNHSELDFVHQQGMFGRDKTHL